MTEPTLDAEQAILRTLLTLCAAVVVLFLLGVLFREEVLTGSQRFVSTFGPWGVALGFFIPDATALPLPHDAFLAAARLGGLPFGTIVIWASAGSILGGLVAWTMARTLVGTRWFEARRGTQVTRAEALFERYGSTALAAAAVTPLPYSIMAWASGGLGLPLGRFLAISSLRVIRVAGYLLAIDLGVVEMMQ